MKRLPLIAFALALATVPAAGQSGRGTAARPAPPPSAPAPVPAPPPPYEPALLRLAEVLGSLAALSRACAADGMAEAAEIAWRRRMEALIAAEAPDDDRRDRLVGAYNLGFITHQQLHRRCHDSTRRLRDDALLEGERLTREIATRFAS